MYKNKFLWKNGYKKVIASLLTLVTLTSVVTPVVYNHYQSNNIVTFNNVNNENAIINQQINENNLFLDNRNQKEAFKDVDEQMLEENFDKLLLVNNNNAKGNTKNITYSSKQNDSLKEIQQQDLINNKQQILNNVKLIKNDELKINDILNKQKEFLNNNPEKYLNAKKELESELDLNIDSLPISTKLSNFQKQKFSRNSTNKNKIEIEAISNSTEFDSTPTDYIKITMSKSESNFIYDLKNKIDLYNKYQNKIYYFNITSTTFAAITWALVAFYISTCWFAWANIALAISTTIQASLMTISVDEGWENYDDVTSTKQELQNFYDSKDCYDTVSFLTFLENNGKIKGDSLAGIFYYIAKKDWKSLGKILSLEIIGYGLDEIAKRLPPLLTPYQQALKWGKSFYGKLENRINDIFGRIFKSKISFNMFKFVGYVGILIGILDLILSMCSDLIDDFLFKEII